MIANQGTDTRVWLVAGPCRAPLSIGASGSDPAVIEDPAELPDAIARSAGGTVVLYSPPQTIERLLRHALDVPGASLLLADGKGALIVDTPGGWTLERFGVAPGSDYAAGRAADVVTRDDRVT